MREVFDYIRSRPEWRGATVGEDPDNWTLTKGTAEVRIRKLPPQLKEIFYKF